MACNKWAAFKMTELVMCLLCLIYKWITDEEASRLFYLLEKISREWPLLNNITWNRTGDMFADVTFGSYAIICLGLLISSCSGELGYMRKTETVLLGIGVLMFFGVGCMVLASIDSIPHNLVDNAVILGTLTLLTGLLFLLDMGVTGNRHKSGKGQDAEFRLKRNIQLPLVPPSESPVKKIDIADISKPETYQNSTGAQANGAYQNGAPATVIPMNTAGFPVNQNGYQNALNQTMAAQGDSGQGYVRDGIVDGNFGRSGVNGVSYTGGVKPMGELRSSMKKREMARAAEKEKNAAQEGRSTPDGYRMRDDTVAKNEYIQMGKKYTAQDFDLNQQLIRKEREKENLELHNKYYDQRNDANDKTYVKRGSPGRDLDDQARPHQYDGYNRRDKVKKLAGREGAAARPESSDEDDREMDRLARPRHRHYDSSDYDDETLQETAATRKLAQENVHRAHQENKRNYYKQRSADELHYATEKYDPPVSQAKLKRSKTPDFDSQWRKDKETHDNKYYHSENEKEDHQEYLNKEKKSLQQWRFSQDLYQDNWRAQIEAEEEDRALNFPRHWKPTSGVDKKYYGAADIPPPAKFTDSAKYKSEVPSIPRLSEPAYAPKAYEPKSYETKSYEPKSYETKSYEPKSYETKSYEPKSYETKSHEPKYKESAGKYVESSRYPDGGKYRSDSDDDSLTNVQIPNVSFLMSERGNRIKPTITPSPVKTIVKEISPKDYHRDREIHEDRITQAAAAKKFFFAEEPPGEAKQNVPAPVTPGSPGFVKQLAKQWPQ